MKKGFTLIFVLFAFISLAQKEHNIWYFGINCGLDFNSGSPVALTNGALNSNEGSSVGCDTDGNLLFYTDGITIWNKNHTVMPNGTGLSGSLTSTQSGLIVKQPGSDSLYYVFSTFDSLCYTVVDMRLNGGLGGVTVKNVKLTDYASEKLCAAANLNGKDFWILSHERNTDGFNAFCVSEKGVSTTPVHSNAGFVTTGGPGQMKFSPNAGKVAFGQPSGPTNPTTCVLDFDCSTGKVSNGFGIPGTYSQVYGLEFSPDGNLLYTGAISSDTLYQYDLNAGSPAAIIASGMSIGYVKKIPGSMQIGPDGKIYLSPQTYTYVDVINAPNVRGLGCNYVHDAVYLAGKTCKLGLPNYITSFYSCQNACTDAPHPYFTTSDTSACLFDGSACVNFTNQSQNATSYQWFFPGGSPSSDTSASPQGICYFAPGAYSVTLIASNGSTYDTLTIPNFVNVYNPIIPLVNQSGDTLFAPPGYLSYQWYLNGNIISGATNYYYVSTQAGSYSLDVTDLHGCPSTVWGINVTTLTPQLHDAGLLIYPNPAKDKLYITGIPASAASARLSMYNVMGEIVFQSELTNSNNELNISSLAKGVYMIRLQIEARQYFLKLAKQ